MNIKKNTSKRKSSPDPMFSPPVKKTKVENHASNFFIEADSSILNYMTSFLPKKDFSKLFSTNKTMLSRGKENIFWQEFLKEEFTKLNFTEFIAYKFFEKPQFREDKFIPIDKAGMAFLKMLHMENTDIDRVKKNELSLAKFIGLSPSLPIYEKRPEETWKSFLKDPLCSLPDNVLSEQKAKEFFKNPLYRQDKYLLLDETGLNFIRHVSIHNHPRILQALTEGTLSLAEAANEKKCFETLAFKIGLITIPLRQNALAFGGLKGLSLICDPDTVAIFERGHLTGEQMVQFIKLGGPTALSIILQPYCLKRLIENQISFEKVYEKLATINTRSWNVTHISHFEKFMLTK